MIGLGLEEELRGSGRNAVVGSWKKKHKCTTAVASCRIWPWPVDTLYIILLFLPT